MRTLFAFFELLAILGLYYNFKLYIMLSRIISFRFPEEVAEIATIRAKEIGYRSATAYVVSLILYDAVTRSTHGVTLKWSKLAADIRDKIMKVILARTKANKGMKAAEVPAWDWETEYASMMQTGQG